MEEAKKEEIVYEQRVYNFLLNFSLFLFSI
jgi:hypothetical protein